MTASVRLAPLSSRIVYDPAVSWTGALLDTGRSSTEDIIPSKAHMTLPEPRRNDHPDAPNRFHSARLRRPEHTANRRLLPQIAASASVLFLQILSYAPTVRYGMMQDTSFNACGTLLNLPSGVLPHSAIFFRGMGVLCVKRSQGL